MRFHWLLLSFLSVLLFGSPAEAGRLLFWRFDSGQNRLSFSTNEGVQPRAQLITNPSRVVIDLPGTSLGRPSVRQNLGGLITELRIGQVDNQTTRLVIELAPGYTVDPQQVRVRGVSPTQWTVVLPPPQRIVQPQTQAIQPPPTQQTSPQNEQPRVQRPPQPTSENRSVETLDDFQVTRSGFFLRINGEEPKKIKVTRSRDRREIDIQLEGVTLPNRLAQENLSVNRYGVAKVAFRQGSNSPPVARITLEVDRDSPDWKASFSTGGLVILPDGVPARQLEDSSSESQQEVPAATVERRVIIEAVDLTVGGSQLLIRADQSVKATSTWNRQEGVYEISIPNAQLADTIRGPSLPAGSTISQVRIRQQDADTVVVAVKPGVGVAIGQLNQPTENSISLQLEQTRQAARPSGGSTSAVIPVPPPERNTSPPVLSSPSRSLPRVPNGRALVVIDPGHGGKDPGAIGRGGLREKDVILPISQQVAQYLEQQGVNAMMTRSDDRFISLEGRVQMANRAGANLFVSIHANSISLSRPDVNGLETYHYSSGLRLAQTIHRSILRNVSIRDRGVRQARFYVLRRSSMPSVLVEVGFVTGRDDAANLSNPTHRSQMAQAIAAGILEYIQQNRV